MLKLTILGEESWNKEKEEFVYSDAIVLELEHSLVSLSKWESIWEKPFLSKDEKTSDQILSYIQCMCDEEIPVEIFAKLAQKDLDKITDYIDAKMTATWFSDEQKGSKNGEIITSELIYYWLVAFTIPFEVKHWHLNRLLTLIKVCSIKQQKPKKMSRSELMARNRMLNEQRRRQLGTNG
jgi:hypothetical protein